MDYNAIFDTGCIGLQSCIEMQPKKCMQPSDKLEFGLYRSLQIYHIDKLNTTFEYWVIIVVCKKIRHDMGTDKTALFIERYRQRAITCSHLKNRILFAIFFNKKFNQCLGITFSLIFGSCRNVLDFKYAFSFIGYDTLAFDSVIVKHIHRAMVEVTVYHILLLVCQ